MENKKVLVKDISLSNCHLSCHPEALNPYQLSERFRYQYLNELHKLPLNSIQQIQFLDPIHVVFDKKHSNKKAQYKFFSGWFWLSLCRELKIKEVRVILHQEEDGEFIEQASWLYLLACELKCMNRKLGLGQLSQTMEYAPKHIIKTVLGECYSYSSTQIIQNISAESSDVLKTQIKKLSPKVSVKKSIFDELLGGN